MVKTRKATQKEVAAAANRPKPLRSQENMLKKRVKDGYCLVGFRLYDEDELCVEGSLQ